MIRKQRAGFHSGFWFVFPPCPQFITAYTAAVFKADKVVPVPRAASVQELLAGARGWVKEEPRALASTRPGIRPLVTQPPGPRLQAEAGHVPQRALRHCLDLTVTGQLLQSRQTHKPYIT